MQILVIGSHDDLAECVAKFGNNHLYVHVANAADRLMLSQVPDVVFDFLPSGTPASLAFTTHFPKAIFLNACLQNLRTITARGYVCGKAPLFGFAGMRSFLQRAIFEISSREEKDEILTGVCAALSTGFQVVDDRIGLVTPRVICMIINEAWFAFQEGISTKKDIDLAMKTGTNYPYGPFEWCDKIGGANVVEFLKALHHETNDERYLVCPLLEKEFASI